MRLLLTLCCLFPCLPILAIEATHGDLDRATAQLRSYLLARSTDTPERVAGYLTTLRADGTWADVDYASQQRANWPTGQHVSRTLQIAIAWRKGGVPEALLAAIHRALGHWRAKDYQCPNWWYNQIGGPLDLLSIGLLLGDQLQTEEFTYLTQTVLPRTKIGMTGQNRVWLAGNTLMGGLLLRDRALVTQAAEVIYAEVVVTGKEGIQPDFSFHQHGSQQQFGNYGMAFANDLIKWAEILHGTPWAMPAEKLQIFRRFLLDGPAWAVWRGSLDISACGRQLAPNSPMSKGAAVLRVLTALTQIDTAEADAYAAAVRRNAPGAVNDLVGNRFFWRSDYLIHRRPDFSCTLKLSSERVIGTESMNSENLSGYYLGDGACYIYRSGEEYTDLFPVWNWRQLPGTTCAQGKGRLPSFGYNKIPTTWVGGVSDGRNGGMAVDYQRVDISGKKADDPATREMIAAKKAWFCFDDQVVCLGAGITSSESIANPLLTTMNQCLLRGPVRVQAGGTVRTLEPGVARPEALAWVEHDGVRYRFLTPQPVIISAGPRTGNWNKVRQVTGNPKEDITLNIFHLAIEHGVHPAGASYAYVIQPADADRQPEMEILQNTPQLQAVRVGSLLQAAFYTAGTLSYAPNRTVTVEAPCLLLLDTAAHRAYLSDPLHTRRTLILNLDGNPYEVTLPQGNFKGIPQMVEVK